MNHWLYDSSPTKYLNSSAFLGMGHGSWHYAERSSFASTAGISLLPKDLDCIQRLAGSPLCRSFQEESRFKGLGWNRIVVESSNSTKASNRHYINL